MSDDRVGDERVGGTAGLKLRAVKWGRYSVLFIGALIVAYFWVRYDTFWTSGGIRSMLKGLVPIGFLTLGLLVPLAAGVFDLSVGTMVGLSGMMLIQLQLEGWIENEWLGVLFVLAVAAVWGLVNGLLVAKVGINSFIATLGTSSVMQAGTYLISDNQRKADALSDNFQEVFESQAFLSQVNALWYLIIAAVILWWVLEYTPIGRYLFATGGNADAARLAGVRTDRYVIGSLVASAMLAAVGGICFVGAQNAASPDTGPPLLFSAFAAAFLGATQFRGRPNVAGALLAIVVLAFLARGLQLQFPGAVWPGPFADGLVLVIAVAATSAAWGGLRQRLRRSSVPTAGP